MITVNISQPDKTYLGKHTYHVYFDGSNKGDTASCAGCVIYQMNLTKKEKIYANSKTLGDKPTSCNVAEYRALQMALQYLVQNNHHRSPVVVFGDSQLVIKQMFGRWRIKDGLYKPAALECKVLINEFANISGKWIPRGHNKEADSLSKQYR